MPDPANPLADVTTEDLVAYKAGDLSKVSTSGLLAIKASRAGSQAPADVSRETPQPRPSPIAPGAPGSREAIAAAAQRSGDVKAGWDLLTRAGEPFVRTHQALADASAAALGGVARFGHGLSEIGRTGQLSAGGGHMARGAADAVLGVPNVPLSQPMAAYGEALGAVGGPASALEQPAADAGIPDRLGLAARQVASLPMTAPSDVGTGVADLTGLEKEDADRIVGLGATALGIPGVRRSIGRGISRAPGAVARAADSAVNLATTKPAPEIGAPRIAETAVVPQPQRLGVIVPQKPIPELRAGPAPVETFRGQPAGALPPTEPVLSPGEAARSKIRLGKGPTRARFSTPPAEPAATPVREPPIRGLLPAPKEPVPPASPEPPPPPSRSSGPATGAATGETPPTAGIRAPSGARETREPAIARGPQADTAPQARPADPAISTAAAPDVPVTSKVDPAPEPPLVAQMRAHVRAGDIEAAHDVFRRAPDQATRNAANAWSRGKDPAPAKHGNFGSAPIIRALEAEASAADVAPPPAAAPAPVPQPVKSRARPGGLGGKRSQRGAAGDAGPQEDISLEGIYDRIDRHGKDVLAGAGNLALKVPGVRLGKTAVETVLDKGFKSEAKRIGPEFAQRVAERKGERALGRHESRKAAVEFDEKIANLSDADRDAVYRYMNSEADHLPAAAGPLKKAIDAVSAEIKALGQAEVERNMRTQEAVDQYPRYLPRQYKGKQGVGKFLQLGDRPRVNRNYLREDAPGLYLSAKELTQDIRTLAEAHGGYAFTREGNTTAVKFKTPDARAAFRNAVRERFSGARQRLGEDMTREIRAGDVGQAKMFGKGQADVPKMKDIILDSFDAIPDEVRASLGEITDPVTGVHDALVRGKLRIADHDFMAGLERGGDAKGAWVSSEKLPGYVEITERWAHPIRGKYARPDVYKWLKGEVGPRDTLGFARGWLDQWKANKTVWSPRTAMRQWFGNPFFMKLAGVDPTNPANWPAMKKALSTLSDAERATLIKEGVLGPHDFASLELERPDSGGSGWGYKVGKALANPIAATKTGAKIQRGLGQFYGAADAFTRKAIYYRNIERGMTPSQAAAEVRKWTPNYDEAGPLVKKLRESVIGSPFATYKAETYRIVANAMKEHPLRLAHSLAFLKGLQYALDNLTSAGDVTEAEREAIKMTRGSKEIITRRSADGKPQTFNAKYIDPIGDWTKSPELVGDDRTWEYLAGLLGLTEAPATDLISTIGRGEDRIGRPNYEPMATAGEKFVGNTKAYLKQIAPGLTPGVGAQAEQLRAAFNDEQLSDRMPAQSRIQAVISALLGIDERPFDAQLERRNTGKRADWLKRDLDIEAGKRAKKGDESVGPWVRGKMQTLGADVHERMKTLTKAVPK